MSFPRTEGQIPIYYNHFNTGRPAASERAQPYTSGYLDLANSPQYPFGFGLSYTTFTYGAPALDKTVLRASEALRLTVTVTNSGNYDGIETVQLYIRDMVASAVRPVKELKGFQRIWLRKGESRAVTFTIREEDLRFYNKDLHYVSEPGDFKVFVGGNSRDVQGLGFTLE
jgi:beta-glucosidase